MFQPISYDIYEEGRDSALQPDSLREGTVYILRLMLHQDEQTRSHYANEYRSRIKNIKHLGHYTVLKAFFAPNFKEGFEAGINHNGIVFNDEPMPPDLEFIPFEAEIGYFFGEAGQSGGKKPEAEISRPRPNELLLVP